MVPQIEKNKIEFPKFEIAPFPPQVVMDSVAGLLEERKARYIRIDGGTSSSARHEMCRQFQVLNIYFEYSLLKLSGKP